MKVRQHTRVNSVILCHDGFRMSVQASREHFCTPRQDKGPYTHVEVGYPNLLEELLLPYADGPSTIAGLRPTLYVNVPAEVVLETIDMHAGIAEGQLPELVTCTRSNDASSEDTDSGGAASSIHLAEVRPEDVRFDSNGEMWAAACEPPEDTPSTLMIDTDTYIEVGETMRSPTAPAASVTGLGLLSPPPTLMHAPISPIQMTNLIDD